MPTISPQTPHSVQCATFVGTDACRNPDGHVSYSVSGFIACVHKDVSMLMTSQRRGTTSTRKQMEFTLGQSPVELLGLIQTAS